MTIDFMLLLAWHKEALSKHECFVVTLTIHSFFTMNMARENSLQL